MGKAVPRRVKPFIFTAILGSGILSLALLYANIFPDQTWNLLTSVQRRYSDIVSRMTPVPTGRERTAEEARIYESVFKYLLQPQVKGPLFLTVKGEDPTDELMARFVSLRRTIKKGSAYSDSSILRGPLDRAREENGVLLLGGNIKWLFGDRVEVDASLHCGHLCGEGGVYQLVKKSDRWTVETCKEHFVE